MADMPLQGLGVLVTRPRAQAAELMAAGLVGARLLGVDFTAAAD